MDHSYSTERERLQRSDHSYFTVGKKTPQVQPCTGLLSRPDDYNEAETKKSGYSWGQGQKQRPKVYDS